MGEQCHISFGESGDTQWVVVFTIFYICLKISVSPKINVHISPKTVGEQCHISFGESGDTLPPIFTSNIYLMHKCLQPGDILLL